MTSTDLCAEQLVQKLRWALPLTAHGRPSLTAALRQCLPGASRVPRVTVTEVFYMGEKDELTCRVDVPGAIDEPVIVVAPITHLAFNRRHQIARDIATYRKCRTEAATVTGRGGL